MLNKALVLLKTLGLHLDTIRIGHKLFSMLTIPNKLTLQKNIAQYHVNNVFGHKSNNTIT